MPLWHVSAPSMGYLRTSSNVIPAATSASMRARTLLGLFDQKIRAQYLYREERGRDDYYPIRGTSLDTFNYTQIIILLRRLRRPARGSAHGRQFPQNCSAHHRRINQEGMMSTKTTP